MIIEKGRPATADGRLKKEIKAYDLLDSLGIEYERADHEAAMTMEACLEIDAALGARTCKNLFLSNRQETAFYLLLIPGDKPFKTKDISAQIGSSRLSFGSHELMEELLDITPGSLTVLGLMNDINRRVQLVIDKDVIAKDHVRCHPCRNTSTLKIRTTDLLGKILPALHRNPIVIEI